MSVSSKLSSLAIAVAAAMLVACGDQEAPAPAGEAATAAPVKSIQKEEVKNPYVVTFDEVESDDRSQYVPINAPLSVVRFYLKNRTWDETADDVAGSLTFGGFVTADGKPAQFQKWEGLDDNLQLANHQYHDTNDAFAKRDFAARFNEMIMAEAQKVGENRLVKFEAKAHTLSIGSYNFDTSSFNVDSCFFVSDAPKALSTADVYAIAQGGSGCSKAYMSNSLSPIYKFGFSNADWLKSLKVEDEKSARAVEKMRLDGKVVVYGYLGEVRRESRVINGQREVGADRVVEIVPVFVDFLDGDTVVYTARKE